MYHTTVVVIGVRYPYTCTRHCTVFVG